MEIYLFVYVNHIFYIFCIYYWYPREYNNYKGIQEALKAKV